MDKKIDFELSDNIEKSLLNKLYAFLPIIFISVILSIIEMILPAEINNLIVFISFCTIGVVAVIYDIPEDLIKKIEQNKILDKIIGEYFKIGKNVNKQIKKAIDTGKVKGALLFSKGMLILFLYSIITGLIAVLISLIKSLFIQTTPDMFSGFSWMFGAGIAALIRWFIVLRKEKKNLDKLIEERQIKESLKSSFSLISTVYVLLFGMTFWGAGLGFSIIFSLEQLNLILYIMVPVIITFIILIFLRVIIYLVYKK